MCPISNPEIESETNGNPIPVWLQEGSRKLIVLAPAMLFVLLVASVALFTKHMPSESYSSLCMDVLRWGGGIFVAGNVIEHGLTKFTSRP